MLVKKLLSSAVIASLALSPMTSFADCFSYQVNCKGPLHQGPMTETDHYKIESYLYKGLWLDAEKQRSELEQFHDRISGYIQSGVREKNELIAENNRLIEENKYLTSEIKELEDLLEEYEEDM